MSHYCCYLRSSVFCQRLLQKSHNFVLKLLIRIQMSLAYWDLHIGLDAMRFGTANIYYRRACLDTMTHQWAILQVEQEAEEEKELEEKDRIDGKKEGDQKNNEGRPNEATPGADSGNLTTREGRATGLPRAPPNGHLVDSGHTPRPSQDCCCPA